MGFSVRLLPYFEMGGAAIVSSGRTTYSDVRNNTHSSWWRDPCLRWNVVHCIGLCASSWMQGYDLSLFNGLQSITPWQEFFDRPTGTKLGIMNACITAPVIIASPLTELICTRYGRRPAVWLGALIATAGSILNAAANGLGMYITGRVIIGVGTACALTGAPVLLQELAHPRYRAKIAGMFTSCQYTAGILSSWLCFGTLHIKGNRSWRIPCYVQVVGPAVILILTITAPESPRWLVSRGRAAEAKRVLAKCHSNGDLDDPLVNLEFHEIEAAIELDEVTTRKNYLDLFRTGANRRRIMVAWIVGIGTNWVGNGIISYYLTPVLNSLGVVQPVKTELINCGLQVWNLILSTGASILCERTGRRPLWLTSTTGMLFSFVIVMALSATFAKTGEKSTGLAVIPFLYIFFGFYDIAWTPLTYSYPIEIMPFDIRSKAMTAYLVVQQLALFVNQLVNPIILDAIGWKYYGVYIAILSILIVIEYLYFPETKGLTVEEIGLIFETGRKGDRLLAANQLRAKIGRSEDVDQDVHLSTSPKINVTHIA